MKESQLLFLTAQMYFAAAFAVEGMSFAAVVIGVIFGLMAVWKVWREQ